MDDSFFGYAALGFAMFFLGRWLLDHFGGSIDGYPNAISRDREQSRFDGYQKYRLLVAGASAFVGVWLLLGGEL